MVEQLPQVIVRWECPLPGCFWAHTGTSREAYVAMQRDGEISDHIGAHDTLEYVQALIDARAVPTEAAPVQPGAPVIRRRPRAGTLEHLADELARAEAHDGGAPKAWELVRAVAFCLRILAMEAEGA